MEHVLEHLVTTAEADAVLEENVMAKRVLSQSSGTRPNGDWREWDNLCNSVNTVLI